MQLPDEFELPRPQDFCRGDFTKGEKHCFVGWQRALLPLPAIWSISTEEERKETTRFFAIALKVAKRMKLKVRLNSSYEKNGEQCWTCFDYNDDTRNTPNRLAKWFEETIKEFGYDIS